MLKNFSDTAYSNADGIVEIPNGLNSSEYNELLNYYLEGIREQIQSKPSFGKINYINGLPISYIAKEAYIDAYKTGRLDATKFDMYKLFNVNYNGNLNKLFSINNLNKFPVGFYNNSEYYDSIISIYKEGFKEQKNGISSTGKINWIFNNVSDKRKWADLIEWYLIGRENATRMNVSVLNDIVKNPSLKFLNDKKYFNGKDYPSQTYFEALNYYKKGIEEQIAGIAPDGAIAWVSNNVSNPEYSNIFIDWYKNGYNDSKLGLASNESTNTNFIYLSDKLDNQVAKEKGFSKKNITSQQILPSSILLPVSENKETKTTPDQSPIITSVIESNSSPTSSNYKPLIISGAVIAGVIGLFFLIKKVGK